VDHCSVSQEATQRNISWEAAKLQEYCCVELKGRRGRLHDRLHHKAAPVLREGADTAIPSVLKYICMCTIITLKIDPFGILQYIIYIY